MPESKKESKWFIVFIVLSVVAVIASSFYTFYFKKNYDFIIETSCDPSLEVCFERDCTNPDDCPPNGLSNFKRFSLNANDFSKCTNEDCTESCMTGLIECVQLECVPDPIYGETCTTLEIYNVNETPEQTEEEVGVQE